MKQSWSHKLFFRINAQVGKRPRLDRLMVFCAHWLIVIMGGVLIALSIPTRSPNVEVLVLLILAVFIMILMGINWIVSFFWKHPRPIVEYPSVTQLIQPSQTIKSFPSDHTMISWMMALFTLALPGAFFGFPLLQIILMLCAVLVSAARVYVGVHYPRDIIGGMVVAVIGTFAIYHFFVDFFFTYWYG